MPYLARHLKFGQNLANWPNSKFLGQTVSNLAKFLGFGQEKAKLAALFQTSVAVAKKRKGDTDIEIGGF